MKVSKVGKPIITAHCLVKNEENFIWYSINSVLPYIDKMIIFDTGSTDRTVEIVKKTQESLREEGKILFEERGAVDLQGHTKLRNEMIEKTETDWFMILDGDEVWPDEQIRLTIEQLKDLTKEKNCILSRFYLSAGDIYHYSTWGQYRYPWRLKGNFTPRFIRKINGIRWGGKFDQDTLFYQDNTKVLTEENCFVSDRYFFHYGILPRSSKDGDVKLGHGRRPVNYTILGFLGHGKKLPKGITPPDIINGSRPNFVPDVTKKLTFGKSLLNFRKRYF
jgi:glycosyltransferase involved in cell wall biosynthesis